MQVKCSKCGQLIALSDIIESSDGRLSHVECARPRTLTADERHLLFVYCRDHIVAQCLSCGLSFRLMELAADPLGGRTNICPRCRKDLTENVRTHLYGCAKLPAEVRLRAQALREAAQRLVRQSQELVENADVRIREAETALFLAHHALRAEMRKRTKS
jgi:ribosomal protein S27E